MDVAIFRWINGWPESFSPLFVFLSEATKHTVGKLLFVLLALALIASGRKGRKAVVLGALSIALANTITDVLKHGIPVLRPCVELADVHARTGVLTSAGTASAHSANMAALAVAFILIWGWRGSFWVPVALLTGISRIYVGVHYPSQVLFGWLCGGVSALVIVKTWDAFISWRGKREAITEAAPAEHPAGPG
jgi:undecaprenyl-diphosphatase